MDINPIIIDNPILILVFFILLVEIIYLVVLRLHKREKGRSLINFTLECKSLSVFLAIFTIILIALLSSMVENYKVVLTVLGIVASIALYILINYWITKLFGREETEDEYKERILEEDKEYKYKFHVGDKVKVISHAYNNDEQKETKIGSTSFVTKRYIDSYNGKTYEIEGSSVGWNEKRFKKVR